LFTAANHDEYKGIIIEALEMDRPHSAGSFFAERTATTELTAESDSDSNFSRPLLYSYPHYLPPQSRNHVAISSFPFIFLGAIVFLMLFLAVLVIHPTVGTSPATRKSACLIAFANTTGEDVLVIWSGLGHDDALLNDTLAFSIQKRTWKIVNQNHHSGLTNSFETCHQQGATQPCPRWKSAISTVHTPLGMIVIGGDAGPSGSAKLLDDVWTLRLPRMEWAMASHHLDVSLEGSNRDKTIVPGKRRSHSSVTLASSMMTQGGATDSVVIFGGRVADGTLKNDLWLMNSDHWPNVTWSMLHPGTKMNKAGSIPGPREGHASVARKNARGDYHEMIVFGGRDENGWYLNDLWSFNFKTEKWEEIYAAIGSPLPPARDLHAIVLTEAGQLIVYGGRSGPTSEASQPLGDLWAFKFASKRWSQVLEYGLRPLPRFLFSAVSHRPQNVSAVQMYIFGGETYEECKMNDVWALDLETLRWELVSQNIFAKRRCSRLFGGGTVRSTGRTALGGRRTRAWRHRYPAFNGERERSRGREKT